MRHAEASKRWLTTWILEDRRKTRSQALVMGAAGIITVSLCYPSSRAFAQSCASSGGVPTASTWSMFGLAIVMLIAGVVLVRRKALGLSGTGWTAVVLAAMLVLGGTAIDRATAGSISWRESLIQLDRAGTLAQAEAAWNQLVNDPAIVAHANVDGLYAREVALLQQGDRASFVLAIAGLSNSTDYLPLNPEATARVRAFAQDPALGQVFEWWANTANSESFRAELQRLPTTERQAVEQLAALTAPEQQSVSFEETTTTKSTGEKVEATVGALIETAFAAGGAVLGGHPELAVAAVVVGLVRIFTIWFCD